MTVRITKSNRGRGQQRRTAVATLLSTLTLSYAAQGADVEVQWDLANDWRVAGYDVWYGDAPGQLNQVVRAGNVSHAKIRGLAEGRPYYFAVRGHGPARLRFTPFSNVAETWTAEPTEPKFNVSRVSGVAPLVVTLSDTSKGKVQSRTWNFGDGTSGRGKTAVKSYTTPGTYTVSLEIFRPGGLPRLRGKQVITVVPDEAALRPVPPEKKDLVATNTNSSQEMAKPKLVAAYSFDEVNGRAVVDSSGNNNNGKMSGVRRIPRGRFGNALMFGSRKKAEVVIPDSPTLHLQHAMTLEAWVQLQDPQPDEMAILCKEGSNGAVYFMNGNSGYAVPSAGVRQADVHQEVFAWNRLLNDGTNAGEWTHVAATFDGNTLKQYINGELVNEQASPGPIDLSNAPLHIGADPKGHKFKGAIDNVRIYDAALSQEQILRNMERPVR